MSKTFEIIEEQRNALVAWIDGSNLPHSDVKRAIAILSNLKEITKEEPQNDKGTTNKAK